MNRARRITSLPTATRAIPTFRRRSSLLLCLIAVLVTPVMMVAAPATRPSSSGAVTPERPANRVTVNANGSAAVSPAVTTTATAPVDGNASSDAAYENEPIHRGASGGAAPGGGGASPGTGTTGNTWGLSKVPAALAAVLIMIFGFRWLMGKMNATKGGGKSTRAMRVLARSVVAPRQQLLLIQIGKRLVVVGNSGGSMNPLCQIDDPDEVAALIGQVHAEKAVTPISSFKSLFTRADHDYGGPQTSGVETRPRATNLETELDDAADDDRAHGSVDRSSASDELDRRPVRDDVQLSGDVPSSSIAATGSAVPSGTNNIDDTTMPAPDASATATSGELTALMARIRKLSQGLPR